MFSLSLNFFTAFFGIKFRIIDSKYLGKKSLQIFFKQSLLNLELILVIFIRLQTWKIEEQEESEGDEFDVSGV